MNKRKKNARAGDTTAATVGYEAELWRMADALRGSMDAAEYKHVVLGLIFLKYISDAFEEQHAKLEAERAEGADPEDPDEYRAVNVFWVPQEARWASLRAHARQPEIGRLVDDAMTAIERDNPALKGVLPKDYARPALDKQRLGQLIDLISNIEVGDANFAWVQHMIHHLAPTGVAGFVLANGSMSSNQSGEGESRKKLIEADLVDCMVALPGPALLLDANSRVPVVPRARQIWFRGTACRAPTEG